ncbi:ParB/RepB/Spo0J family partition protein [Plastorhodobacter daqingensis]|uniref:ParB/RepB/Spo0J family partition protein n=1 Tax=Plastorhodobacter daqingensis TaxID=1387281 RepID=A0ABW2UN23_9RHOB
MATAAQKITLSPSRDIPFNKLVLSQSNVRRIQAGISVEELAEDIARRGLLQSLNVRPVLDAEGAETGMFEVPAGGRRYQALALLVKQKRLAKTAPVPCVVRDPASSILAEDDSLAENTQRVPLHALDQFRAFLDMRTKGMTEEEIASAFFTTAQVVKQRLRLASVSPILLDIYAEDGMRLEELMAFTVNPDHARQEQVWEAIQQSSFSRQPWQIRRLLTETTVRADDKRALFVGVDVYQQAGGIILRDLFDDDEGGWLQDPALLDRLVSEKLKALTDEVAAEGWKWIAADTDLPYGYDRSLRALDVTYVDLTDEERAAREVLREEYDRIEAENEGVDELPDEIDQRLAEIEEALDTFEQRAVIYDPAEIGRAGVFIGIDADGKAIVDRGYVRPEDEAPIEAGDEEGDAEARPDTGMTGAAITIGGQPAEPEDDDEGDTIKPLPERLVIELTAFRTLALRDAVASDPHVAITALLHTLVRDCFGIRTHGTALQASVREVFLGAQSPDLADSPVAKSIDARHAAWKADMPLDDDGALWDWLDNLDQASRLALLAHCASFGVNALYERPNPYSGSGVSQHGLDRRMAEADRMALATGLDLVEAGWKPTAQNYFSRVTKARIVQAVREGAGDRDADLMAHLPKGEMVKEAERLLADTGWLPEPLRRPMDVAAAEPSGQEDDTVALPDFLAGDEEGATPDAADDPAARVAAE